MTAPAATCATAGFDASRVRFEALLGFLDGEAAAGLSHCELEDRLAVDGRELTRLLLQDRVDLRAVREQRVEAVLDGDGVRHGAVEAGHERVSGSVFGEIEVTRMAYRARGAGNLHPADAALNLPVERHSHGLRRMAAIEASRGSYDDAVAAVGRATGQQPGKRQVQELAGRAVVDFDAFYEQRDQAVAAHGDALVMSCDGKGVVIRHDALRASTARAAAGATTKLKTRLSKGEKRNRKRMAEVGAVYDAAPVPRTAADVLPYTDQQRADATAGPVAKNKWLTASVVDNAAEVVADVFDEAQRRDPGHTRTWVALVDGNNHRSTASGPRPARAGTQ